MYKFAIYILLLSFTFSSSWIGMKSDTPKALKPTVISSNIEESYIESFHELIRWIDNKVLQAVIMI